MRDGEVTEAALGSGGPSLRWSHLKCWYVTERPCGAVGVTPGCLTEQPGKLESALQPQKELTD